MLVEKRCMNCMSLLEDDATECPYCGFHVNKTENSEEYLKVGTEFADRYVIGNMQSYSGATARYIGFDKIEKTPVYIYEFFPANISKRGENGEVLPLEGSEDNFEINLKQFRQNARAVARLRDLSFMVPVYDIFEENGSIYSVSEYVEFNTLNDLLKQKGGKLTWEETRKLFIPFLSSLSSCHSAGLYHYGICPSNILIGEDGKLRLIGFDIPSVRVMSTALRPQLADGYAAPEQYSFDNELSAATDVYSVTAVIFRCVTGNAPPNGAHRNPKGEDLLLSAEIAHSLPTHVSEALSAGLQPRMRKRIESIEELRDKLTTGAVVSALAEETKVVGIAGAIKELDTEEKKPAKNPYALYLTLAIIVLILLITLVVVIFIFNGGNKKPAEDTSSTVETTLVTTTTTTTEPTTPVNIVPDIISSGTNYYDLTVSNNQRVFSSFPLEIAGYLYSDEERNVIVDQDPKPGESLEEGASIKVYLSLGKEVTRVPDVTGWNMEHARLYLEALGFRVEFSDASDPTIPFNAVVGSWPSQGNLVDSDNTITLLINKTVPTTTTALSPEENLDALS